MRILISSRYSNYETKKAIRFAAHDLETWIPKSWILETRKQNEDDLYCDYWINIPNEKKTNKELILLAYMQFVSREIKHNTELSNMDGLISYARDRSKEFDEIKGRT